MPPKNADPKVQAKLSFAPAPKDSQQAQELSESVRERASVVRYYSPKKSRTGLLSSTPIRSRTSRGTQQTLNLSSQSMPNSSSRRRNDDSDHEYDNIYGTQIRSSPYQSPKVPDPPRRQRANSYGIDDLENALGSETTVTPRKASQRRFGKISGRSFSQEEGVPPAVDHESVGEDQDVELPELGSEARPEVLRDDAEEEDENDEVLPIPRSRAGLQILGDDEEEDIVLPSSTRRPSAFSVPSEPASKRTLRNRVVYLDSDEAAEPPSSSARGSKRSANDAGSSSPLKKRRLQQGHKPTNRKRQEQEEEILDDLEDLKDNDTIQSSLRPSSRINSSRYARQQQLAKLAARRNKTDFEEETASGESSGGEELPVATYDSLYPDEEDYDSEDDSLIDDSPLPQSSDNEEPEALTINRTIFDIPSALYYVIRQLLYYKFLPPFTLDPTDEATAYYKTANSLIDKRLQSLANTTISSIWRPAFVACLYSRPIMVFPNEPVLWPACEACGRKDRPARYVLRFEGACYDAWTLAAIDKHDCKSWSRFGFTPEEAEGEPDRDPEDYTFIDDHDHDHEDGNGEEEGMSRDQRRQQRSGKARIWYLGSECLSNAMKAHKALHWRWGVGAQIGKALNAMKVVLDDPDEQDKDETANEEDAKQKEDALPEDDDELPPRTRRRTQVILSDSENEDLEEANSSDDEIAAPKPQSHNHSPTYTSQKKEKEMQEKEDHYLATLSQLEDQGYMQSLQDDFMDRFQLAGEDDYDD